MIVVADRLIGQDLEIGQHHYIAVAGAEPADPFRLPVPSCVLGPLPDRIDPIADQETRPQRKVDRVAFTQDFQAASIAWKSTSLNAAAVAFF